MKSKKEKMIKLKTAGIYFVSSQELSSYPTLDILESFLKSGGRLFQLREKTLTKRELYNLALRVRELTAKYDALFIVNDHVDIAVASLADGVHLGKDDLPIEEARKILGPDFIIGSSTHCVSDVKEAIALGADYINMGPVFATQTKPGVKALNEDQLKAMVDAANDCPYTFMGGIKKDNLRELIGYAPSALAMISEISKAKDLESKIKELFSISSELFSYSY